MAVIASDSIQLKSIKETTDKAVNAFNIAAETNQYFWFQNGIEYYLSHDTSVVSGKEYYSRSGTEGSYTYTLVTPVGTEDPSQQGWFEKNADTGAHITETPKDNFLEDPTNGGGNLLARSNGIALRDGLVELATLQQSGMDINGYDTNGDPVNITHLGYADGNAYSGRSTAPFFTFGTRAASDIGNYSVAEGSDVQAIAYCSHAEGHYTVASGATSHAEGMSSRAENESAHAEGSGTVASGRASHSEGIGTTASGYGSHAGGYQTIAAGLYQTVIGEYNVEDEDPLFIIGNGAGNLYRSNALAVDFHGELALALRTTAAAGTTDGDLYAAITAAGWASEVIA